MKKKLLIVEDNFEESLRALALAEKAGFEDITIASNLENALKDIPKVGAVVTDLFFPSGNVNVDAYAQRILPLYIADARSNGRLPSISSNKDRIAEAVQNVSAVLGMRPEQYVEDVLAKEFPAWLLEDARASLPDYEKQFNIRSFLKGEKNLPVGILVTEEAQKYKIPSVIVTSASDHGGLLTPLVPIVKVPYVCQLVDGQKDWQGGFKKLLKQIR